MRFRILTLALLPDRVDASPGPEVNESPNSDATLALFGRPSLGLLQMWSWASSVLTTTWMRFFVSRLWASAWKGYCKEKNRYIKNKSITIFREKSLQVLYPGQIWNLEMLGFVEGRKPEYQHLALGQNWPRVPRRALLYMGDIGSAAVKGMVFKQFTLG